MHLVMETGAVDRRGWPAVDPLPKPNVAKPNDWNNSDGEFTAAMVSILFMAFQDIELTAELFTAITISDFRTAWVVAATRLAPYFRNLNDTSNMQEPETEIPVSNEHEGKDWRDLI